MPIALPVKVRDLWLHKDIGYIDKGQAFGVYLEGNGGSAMFRLSSVSDVTEQPKMNRVVVQ